MSTFDLSSIYISNLLGVTLLGVLLISNLWRFFDMKPENKCLFYLMLFTLSNCLVDPLVYSFDGRPGPVNRIIVYAGNNWLYFTLLCSAVFWVHFLCIHLNGYISRRRSISTWCVVGVGVILLLVNLFVPCVFSVDENNVYDRTYGFWYFVFANYGLLLYSILVYWRARLRGGLLKFFPIWVYAIPILVGGVVQSFFYGASLTSVCLAISVASVLASLQNELIFRDTLTGIYNRAYLDYLLKQYSKKKRAIATGIMLDLNAFKQINDELGHAVGDEALKNTARIMRKVVDDLGTVIRYAGDEFIVIINTQDDKVIATCMSGIRRGFKEFNETSGKKYTLQASMGSCKMDFSKFDVDEFVNEIDRKMYEDKRSYYVEHGDADRRHR